MTNSIWTWLAPILAALAGILIGLYVRETSRSAAKQQLTEMLRGELAIFKNDLGTWLNGRYIFSNGSTLTGAEIGRRLDSQDTTIKDLNRATNDRLVDMQVRVDELSGDTKRNGRAIHALEVRSGTAGD